MFFFFFLTGTLPGLIVLQSLILLVVQLSHVLLGVHLVYSELLLQRSRLLQFGQEIPLSDHMLPFRPRLFFFLVFVFLLAVLMRDRFLDLEDTLGFFLDGGVVSIDDGVELGTG